MIKAIVFDYGGVVSSGGLGMGLSKNLSQKLNISEDEATKILLEPWHSLVRGQVDEDSFWRQVENQYGQEISTVSKDVWATWDQMIPRSRILKLIRELKSKGYIVGLLSNVVHPTSHIIKIHGGYDLFSPCLLSNELGYAKPDPSIYQKLVEELPGVMPEEVLFIDDQEKCMPPARELGIKTIVATNEREIIDTVWKALG